MNRRQFVRDSGAGMMAFAVNLSGKNTLMPGPAATPQEIQTLPGTQPLTWTDDLSEKMMDGALRFVER